MKKLLLSTLMLVATLTMSAVPAKKEWRTLTQGDGTQITLMLIGDENFHCYLTTDGLAVVEEDGNYYYANAMGEMLQKTDMLAHDADQRSFQETQAVATLGNHDDVSRIWRSAPNKQYLRSNKIGTPTGNFHGSKKGIIILVSFNDLDFTVENPQQAFSDLANKENYSNNYGAYGSVHDYFKAMSRGAFDLTFDVVGPYKAPQNASYYGNNSSYTTDTNIRSLIKFAMNSADADVNYKDYDWDGDGEVDQVFVLYAGYGEAQGAPSWTIWPHESQLGMQSFRLDGVTLNTYACGNELEGTSGGRMAGLGTICHEFTHCLGLPDFYDTNRNSGATNSNYGMGDYDLMCSGSYNGNSWYPAAYTAYERNFCGWFDFDELKETDSYNVKEMKPLEDSGNAFIVYNPANHNEYYIFENRSRKYGWDKGLAGQGLLIYHVNYNAQRWRNNTVNTTGYGDPGMQVVPADNSFGYYDVAKDLWPSTQGVTIMNHFSEDTTPGAILFNNNTDGTKKLHIDLNKIKLKSSNGYISFVYNNGTEEFTPTGIKENLVKGNANAGIYSLNGMLIMNTTDVENAQLQRGIYIVKNSDGTTKKIRVD